MAKNGLKHFPASTGYDVFKYTFDGIKITDTKLYPSVAACCQLTAGVAQMSFLGESTAELSRAYKPPEDWVPPKPEPQVEAKPAASAALDQTENIYTIPKSIVARLPEAARITLSMGPTQDGYALLVSLLTIITTLGDRVWFRYIDGTRSYLGFFTIIVGEQASGKSVIGRVVNQWMRHIKEADDAAYKAADKYKEDLRLWEKQQRKGAKQEPPKKPQQCIRMISPTCSNSALLQALKDAEGHCLFMFAPELETVVKNAKSGTWAEKWDIYKKAFEREEHSQTYVSAESVSGVAPVALNFLATGTPGAFQKFFSGDNIEGGLATRSCVAEMQENRYASIPHYKEISEAEAKVIDEAAERLMNLEGEVKVSRLTNAISEWVEQKRVEAMKDDDCVLDTFRKRAAKIGMRAGVAIHLLMGTKSEAKVAVDVALLVAERTLQTQMKYFGKQIEQQQVIEYKKPLATLYDRLPEVFSADDVAKLKGRQKSDSTVRKAISRWVQAGLCKKIEGTETWLKQ